MNPFGDFTFFALILYAVVPTVLLGLFGRANRGWLLLVTLGLLSVQFSEFLAVRPNFEVREIWIVLGYALYEGAVAFAFVRRKSRVNFWIAIVLAILPLAAAKTLPIIAPDTALGFLGISYVTFRALDVVLSIQDGVVKSLAPAQYFAFVFFFPAVSSGPLDRYRRFGQDWARTRTRAEFLDDLDFAIARVFRGFLYKFIIAALMHERWIVPLGKLSGGLAKLGLMYADTLYLFFDFAGYSAFAVGFSRLFGIRTPENFDAPFIAKNIRDFWNRWHISLSFWFRDHVYMRFLLAAAKGKYFKGKHTANYAGLFLTFGLMGLWHGLELRYIVYGLYHAALLSGYDWFARWNKQAKRWGDGPLWRAANVLLTFNAFAFGIMIFNGHVLPVAPPRREEIVEKADAYEISGVVWDRAKPTAEAQVDIYVDYGWMARVPANQYREDLRMRGMGDGRHGFTYTMPWWIRNGAAHTIEVRVVGPGRYLRNSPEVIACPNELLRPPAAVTPTPATPAPDTPVR